MFFFSEILLNYTQCQTVNITNTMKSGFQANSDVYGWWREALKLKYIE